MSVPSDHIGLAGSGTALVDYSAKSRMGSRILGLEIGCKITCGKPFD